MDSSVNSSLNPNKHLEEQFVSNLNGCSMLELVLLTSIFSVAILIRRCIGFHGRIDHDTKSTSFKKNDDAIVATKNRSAYMVTTAVDFLFIVLPIIVLADWTSINAILLAVVLFFCFRSRRYGSSVSLKGVQPLRTYISSYRVTLMLVTCFCILAVEFKIFPRRYAKTETYGTSMVFFVSYLRDYDYLLRLTVSLCQGGPTVIISPLSFTSLIMDLGVGAYVLANSLVSRQARGILRTSLRNYLQSTSPLLFLGFTRLVSTSGVNYQVHLGEYGVHWNFFFTLAAVSILTSIVNSPPSYCEILGSLILIGYWGMYLVGVQLGSYLFFENYSTATGANKWSRIRLWILAPVLMLAILTLADYIPGPKISILEEAFSRNLMGTFLLANLMTGLVNLSMNALFISAVSVLIILCINLFILASVFGVADFYVVKLKFW